MSIQPGLLPAGSMQPCQNMMMLYRKSRMQVRLLLYRSRWILCLLLLQLSAHCFTFSVSLVRKDSIAERTTSLLVGYFPVLISWFSSWFSFRVILALIRVWYSESISFPLPCHTITSVASLQKWKAKKRKTF